jgi:hypothetical protein
MIADIEADDAAATAHRVNAENEGRERPKRDSTRAIKIQRGIIMKRTIKHISQLLLPIAFAILSASFVLAQPGTPPNSSGISDQKAGSVLIFNYYGSHAYYREIEDTQIHITNTNLQNSASMSIFFIDPASGNVDNAYICLAANETGSFLMSDVDPGAKGYIIAVSVDSTGRPNQFNYFIGSESIKMASGHMAALDAETISALAPPPPTGIQNNIAATLKFDGEHYDKVSSALALDHVPAIGDGNKTLVIVNQIGGSLLNGSLPDNLTSLTGTVYDRATNAYFWQVGNINSCQFRKVIGNDFPQTMPNMSGLITPGVYGWMKFWPHGANKGVTGAVLYLNTSTQPNVFRFIGGRNLHHLALTTDELTIPVISPVC